MTNEGRKLIEVYSWFDIADGDANPQLLDCQYGP